MKISVPQPPLARPLILVTYGVSLVALFLLIFFSRSLILVSLIGVGLGVIVSPLLGMFYRRFNIPRILSAFLLMIFFFLLAALIFFFLARVVTDQLHLLTDRAPEIAANLQNRFNGLFTRYPWMAAEVKKLNVGGSVQEGVFQVYSGVQSSLSALANFLFSLIIGLYTAVGVREYFKGFIRMFPPRFRPKTEEVLHAVAKSIRVWFRAQLIDMVIMGLITAIGLSILGVDYWAIFALLTVILGIIPYVGIVFVVIFASLVTLASNPDMVPWVLGVFLITQQIEGNVILPMVMRGQAEIPEVPLLISMLFLGSWFGILGVFVAPPLFCVLKTLYVKLYLPSIEGEEPPGDF